MYDVEAGKFGMNFQGIGKEQVRLGFIRLLGFCGRDAFRRGKFDEVMMFIYIYNIYYACPGKKVGKMG